MLSIISWIIYGLIVGLIAKALHPGDDPVGFLPTIGIGIAGSYIGGLINFLLGMGGQPFSASGILMGVVGGVIFCWLWRKYNLRKEDIKKKIVEPTKQPKSVDDIDNKKIEKVIAEIKKPLLIEKLNNASMDDLLGIKGIGTVTVQAIEALKPFTSLEDFQNSVSAGVFQKLLAWMKK